MGEQFDERHAPVIPKLPEFSGVENEQAVTELAIEVVESVRALNQAVEILDRTLDGSSLPLDGVFVENLMRPAITRSEKVVGITQALDALAPLNSGASWQEWADQAATETEDPAE